jgi:diaminopimelate epimerase
MTATGKKRMKINFTKMHGLGNDFILIDCLKQDCRFTPPQSPPFQGGDMRGYPSEFGELAKRLCNRRFGIGADQILLLYPSTSADFKMRIFNTDGSEVEMCGNGIRCLAKYIWDRNLSDKDILNIETLAGIIKPGKAGNLVKVDMGEPIFEPEKIPVNIQLSAVSGQQSAEKISNLKSQISNFRRTGSDGRVGKTRSGRVCAGAGLAFSLGPGPKDAPQVG